MFGLPPIPPFEALHPIVVHFPIGILLIAWLPMLIALIDKKRRNAWLAAAAMLLIVGTTACFAAVLTGEAADEIAVTTTIAAEQTLHDHEETAETARNLFIGVTLVFIAVWITWNKVPEKKKAIISFAGGTLVVVTYALGALALMNAGHLGGVLVHQHGIHAPITAGAPPIDSANTTHEDDD